MRLLALAAALAAGGAAAPATRGRSSQLPPPRALNDAPPIVGQACDALPGGGHDRWTLTALGQLVGAASGLCATAQAPLPVPDGTAVAMAPCIAGGDPTQAFAYVAGNASIVLAGQVGSCLNLQGYGTTPGTEVWLFSCSAGDCKGNCDWAPAPSPTAAGPLTNAASGLCLQDGTPPPPLPQTCAAGSPSYGLPFCDPALPVEARVADLLARLDLKTKVQQFSIPVSRFAYNATLNLKGYLCECHKTQPSRTHTLSVIMQLNARPNPHELTITPQGT
jgi:hypothetical protein